MIESGRAGGACPRAMERVGRVRRIVAELGGDRDFDAMWDAYKPLILALSAEFGLTRHLEVGGGRDPLLSPGDVASRGLHVTVNDISQGELDHVPAPFATACFDIAGEAPAGSYDLIYSRMVMEHIRDVPTMWRNTQRLLAPGGVAISVYPTLFALPFVVNKLVPEPVSQAIVRVMYPHRTDTEDPKFPAHYDRCYGSESRMRPMMERAGLPGFTVLPFYDHLYYERLPVIRPLYRRYAALARRLDLRWQTAYAVLIAVKDGGAEAPAGGVRRPEAAYS